MIFAKRKAEEVAEALAQKSGIDQPTVAPATGYQQKGRQGKAPLMTWHDPAVVQQLKMLAAEKGKTQQKLMAEALNMLFAKYGKGQIA